MGYGSFCDRGQYFLVIRHICMRHGDSPSRAIGKCSMHIEIFIYFADKMKC